MTQYMNEILIEVTKVIHNKLLFKNNIYIYTINYIYIYPQSFASPKKKCFCTLPFFGSSLNVALWIRFFSGGWSPGGMAQRSRFSMWFRWNRGTGGWKPLQVSRDKDGCTPNVRVPMVLIGRKYRDSWG